MEARRPKRNLSALKRAVEEAKDRLRAKPGGDWKSIKALHLVGLYARMHERVYGVFPDDLADDWYPARSMAKRLLEESFGGDGEKAAAFMRWVWEDEVKKFPKRGPDDTFRITWRYQFGRKLLTKYRIYGE